MARTRLAAGRSPLKAKRMPLSLKAIEGGLLDKLADQLVHMQITQTHGSAYDLRAGLPHLADHLVDGHHQPQLDREIALPPILHPIGKVLHAQVVDAFLPMAPTITRRLRTPASGSAPG